MKILFIGNSHTYVNEVPKLVKELFLKDNINVDVFMIAHPGWYLKKHLENPEVKFNILNGGFDIVVIQEHAHPFDNIDSFYESAKIINGFVKEANSFLLIYTTWPRMLHPEDSKIMIETHRDIGKLLNCAVSDCDKEWMKHFGDDSFKELYGPDGEHASLIGSSLAARMLYEKIKEMKNL